ncbi:unnamed protein product [Dovyalis caffra]|uniref:Pentatricopeptide repeat-containing protein n=1 Tax=Dovyalis caffra TaxID=77055 RepID=A0AAV1R525_9ROSI|nr:unnamed protein product [Dovyalis caffra]
MLIEFQSLLLQLSKTHQTLSRTKQLHALLTKTHLLQDPFYATKLVRFYAINSDLSSARNLFDRTPQRSVFLWNSIIRAYAQAHRFDDAFFLYEKMIGTDVRPDNYTYACLLRACFENFYVDGLRIVHGGVIVSGLGLNSVTCSALVTGYSKMGLVGEASKVFCGVFEPDLVLWNAMISGCGYCGFCDKGLLFFNEMRYNGKLKPDGYTFVGLIVGLADSCSLQVGQGIHGLCLKSGFDCDDHVGSSLVSMYSRFRCMNLAYGVFRSLYQPDLVTWSALITGFSQSGECEKALLFYKNLNLDGKKPDCILIASVLVATAQLANVGPGNQIHGYVVRLGFESNVMVSSALIDMYSKCGFVGLGLCVFENMPNRNIVSYNSIISGLGLHGLASQAFDMFTEILEKGLKPDESTFSALLCACCHAGLVKDGREIFRRMKDDFCVQARAEHYVHIVKLLGMAGELDEAYNFILSLKQPVDSGIWGALLSCCDAQGDSELAEIVAQQLFDSKPKKGAYRVMLSNIYAGDRRWDDVEKMRDDITIAGTEKMPGLSWIGGY